MKRITRRRQGTQKRTAVPRKTKTKYHVTTKLRNSKPCRKRQAGTSRGKRKPLSPRTLRLKSSRCKAKQHPSEKIFKNINNSQNGEGTSADEGGSKPPSRAESFFEKFAKAFGSELQSFGSSQMDSQGSSSNVSGIEDVKGGKSRTLDVLRDRISGGFFGDGTRVSSISQINERKDPSTNSESRSDTGTDKKESFLSSEFDNSKASRMKAFYDVTHRNPTPTLKKKSQTEPNLNRKKPYLVSDHTSIHKPYSFKHHLVSVSQDVTAPAVAMPKRLPFSMGPISQEDTMGPVGLMSMRTESRWPNGNPASVTRQKMLETLSLSASNSIENKDGDTCVIPPKLNGLLSKYVDDKDKVNKISKVNKVNDDLGKFQPQQRRSLSFNQKPVSCASMSKPESNFKAMIIRQLSLLGIADKHSGGTSPPTKMSPANHAEVLTIDAQRDSMLHAEKMPDTASSVKAPHAVKSITPGSKNEGEKVGLIPVSEAASSHRFPPEAKCHFLGGKLSNGFLSKLVDDKNGSRKNSTIQPRRIRPARSVPPSLLPYNSRSNLRSNFIKKCKEPTFKYLVGRKKSAYNRNSPQRREEDLEDDIFVDFAIPDQPTTCPKPQMLSQCETKTTPDTLPDNNLIPEIRCEELVREKNPILNQDKTVDVEKPKDVLLSTLIIPDISYSSEIDENKNIPKSESEYPPNLSLSNADGENANNSIELIPVFIQNDDAPCGKPIPENLMSLPRYTIPIEENNTIDSCLKGKSQQTDETLATTQIHLPNIHSQSIDNLTSMATDNTISCEDKLGRLDLISDKKIDNKEHPLHLSLPTFDHESKQYDSEVSLSLDIPQSEALFASKNQHQHEIGPPDQALITPKSEPVDENVVNVINKATKTKEYQASEKDTDPSVSGEESEGLLTKGMNFLSDLISCGESENQAADDINNVLCAIRPSKQAKVYAPEIKHDKISHNANKLSQSSGFGNSSPFTQKIKLNNINGLYQHRKQKNGKTVRKVSVPVYLKRFPPSFTSSGKWAVDTKHVTKTKQRNLSFKNWIKHFDKIDIVTDASRTIGGDTQKHSRNIKDTLESKRPIEKHTSDLFKYARCDDDSISESQVSRNANGIGPSVLEPTQVYIEGKDVNPNAVRWSKESEERQVRREKSGIEPSILEPNLLNDKDHGRNPNVGKFSKTPTEKQLIRKANEIEPTVLKPTLLNDKRKGTESFAATLSKQTLERQALRKPNTTKPSLLEPTVLNDKKKDRAPIAATFSKEAAERHSLQKTKTAQSREIQPTLLSYDNEEKKLTSVQLSKDLENTMLLNFHPHEMEMTLDSKCEPQCEHYLAKKEPKTEVNAFSDIKTGPPSQEVEGTLKITNNLTFSTKKTKQDEDSKEAGKKSLDNEDNGRKVSTKQAINEMNASLAPSHSLNGRMLRNLNKKTNGVKRSISPYQKLLCSRGSKVRDESSNEFQIHETVTSNDTSLKKGILVKEKKMSLSDTHLLSHQDKRFMEIRTEQQTTESSSAFNGQGSGSLDGSYASKSSLCIQNNKENGTAIPTNKQTIEGIKKSRTYYDKKFPPKIESASVAPNSLNIYLKDKTHKKAKQYKKNATSHLFKRYQVEGRSCPKTTNFLNSVTVRNERSQAMAVLKSLANVLGLDLITESKHQNVSREYSHGEKERLLNEALSVVNKNSVVITLEGNMVNGRSPTMNNRQTYKHNEEGNNLQDCWVKRRNLNQAGTKQKDKHCFVPQEDSLRKEMISPGMKEEMASFAFAEDDEQMNLPFVIPSRPTKLSGFARECNFFTNLKNIFEDFLTETDKNREQMPKEEISNVESDLKQSVKPPPSGKERKRPSKNIHGTKSKDRATSDCSFLKVLGKKNEDSSKNARKVTINEFYPYLPPTLKSTSNEHLTRSQPPPKAYEGKYDKDKRHMVESPHRSPSLIENVPLRYRQDFPESGRKTHTKRSSPELYPSRRAKSPTLVEQREKEQEKRFSGRDVKRSSPQVSPRRKEISPKRGSFALLDSQDSSFGKRSGDKSPRGRSPVLSSKMKENSPEVYYNLNATHTKRRETRLNGKDTKRNSPSLSPRMGEDYQKIPSELVEAREKKRRETRMYDKDTSRNSPLSLRISGNSPKVISSDLNVTSPKRRETIIDGKDTVRNNPPLSFRKGENSPKVVSSDLNITRPKRQETNIDDKDTTRNSPPLSFRKGEISPKASSDLVETLAKRRETKINDKDTKSNSLPRSSNMDEDSPSVVSSDRTVPRIKSRGKISKLKDTIANSPTLTPTTSEDSPQAISSGLVDMLAKRKEKTIVDTRRTSPSLSHRKGETLSKLSPSPHRKPSEKESDSKETKTKSSYLSPRKNEVLPQRILSATFLPFFKSPDKRAGDKDAKRSSPYLSHSKRKNSPARISSTSEETLESSKNGLDHKDRKISSAGEFISVSKNGNKQNSWNSLKTKASDSITGAIVKKKDSPPPIPRWSENVPKDLRKVFDLSKTQKNISLKDTTPKIPDLKRVSEASDLSKEAIKEKVVRNPKGEKGVMKQKQDDDAQLLSRSPSMREGTLSVNEKKDIRDDKFTQSVLPSRNRMRSESFERKRKIFSPDRERAGQTFRDLSPRNRSQDKEVSAGDLSAKKDINELISLDRSSSLEIRGTERLSPSVTRSFSPPRRNPSRYLSSNKRKMMEPEKQIISPDSPPLKALKFERKEVKKRKKIQPIDLVEKYSQETTVSQKSKKENKLKAVKAAIKYVERGRSQGKNVAASSPNKSADISEHGYSKGNFGSPKQSHDSIPSDEMADHNQDLNAKSYGFMKTSMSPINRSKQSEKDSLRDGKKSSPLGGGKTSLQSGSFSVDPGSPNISDIEESNDFDVGKMKESLCNYLIDWKRQNDQYTFPLMEQPELYARSIQTLNLLLESDGSRNVDSPSSACSAVLLSGSDITCASEKGKSTPAPSLTDVLSGNKRMDISPILGESRYSLQSEQHTALGDYNDYDDYRNSTMRFRDPISTVSLPCTRLRFDSSLYDFSYRRERLNTQPSNDSASFNNQNSAQSHKQAEPLRSICVSSNRSDDNNKNVVENKQPPMKMLPCNDEATDRLETDISCSQVNVDCNFAEWQRIVSSTAEEMNHHEFEPDSYCREDDKINVLGFTEENPINKLTEEILHQAMIKPADEMSEGKCVSSSVDPQHLESLNVGEVGNNTLSIEPRSAFTISGLMCGSTRDEPSDISSLQPFLTCNAVKDMAPPETHSQSHSHNKQSNPGESHFRTFLSSLWGRSGKMSPIEEELSDAQLSQADSSDTSEYRVESEPAMHFVSLGDDQAMVPNLLTNTKNGDAILTEDVSCCISSHTGDKISTDNQSPTTPLRDPALVSSSDDKGPSFLSYILDYQKEEIPKMKTRNEEKVESSVSSSYQPGSDVDGVRENRLETGEVCNSSSAKDTRKEAPTNLSDLLNKIETKDTVETPRPWHEESNTESDFNGVHLTYYSMKSKSDALLAEKRFTGSNINKENVVSKSPYRISETSDTGAKADNNANSAEDIINIEEFLKMIRQQTDELRKNRENSNSFDYGKVSNAVYSQRTGIQYRGSDFHSDRDNTRNWIYDQSSKGRNNYMTEGSRYNISGLKGDYSRNVIDLISVYNKQEESSRFSHDRSFMRHLHNDKTDLSETLSEVSTVSSTANVSKYPRTKRRPQRDMKSSSCHRVQAPSYPWLKAYQSKSNYRTPRETTREKVSYNSPCRRVPSVYTPSVSRSGTRKNGKYANKTCNKTKQRGCRSSYYEPHVDLPSIDEPNTAFNPYGADANVIADALRLEEELFGRAESESLNTFGYGGMRCIP